MHALPDDAISVVLTLVDSETLRALRVVSPRVHALVDGLSNARVAILKDARVGILCDVLDRFDLVDARKVQFRQKWIGNTGYIDKVSANEVPCAISYGVDCYDRPFVHLKNARGRVLTLFQRYTYCAETWTCASSTDAFGGDRLHLIRTTLQLPTNADTSYLTSTLLI